MLEAITYNKRQDQRHLQKNNLRKLASQLPRKDHLLLVTKEVHGSPQRRVCLTVTENTVLISPPRIGHKHEQVVFREVKSPKGETTLENLNGLHKDSPQKPRVMTMSSNKLPLLKGRKWVFPRIDYIRENPDKLLKSDTLRTLCLAAELDIVSNIERYLKEVAGLLEDL